MGDVVSFPAKHASTDQRMGAFFDPDRWLVSKRGNSYTRTADGFCVTVFQSWGGFRWSIARSAGEGPMFSDRIFDSEDEARRASWAALAGMMEQSA